MPAVSIAVFGASHRIAEHAFQMSWFCWNSESCSGSDGQQTTKQWPWPLFGANLSLHWAGCRQLSYKMRFSSHVLIQPRNGLLLLRRIREGDTSKWQFFWFLVSSWKWKSLSHVQHFETPRAIACQAPLSMGFSRQEYWKCCHSLLQGFFPTQGSNPGLLHCRWILYHLSHLGCF